MTPEFVIGFAPPGFGDHPDSGHAHTGPGMAVGLAISIFQSVTRFRR